MKALRLLWAPLLGIVVLPLLSSAGDPFREKLSKQEKALHALNRLTFGPRPGELERVQAIGVDNWVRQQLDPERIAENPALVEKLKPLETLRMAAPEMAEAYPLRRNVKGARPRQGNERRLLEAPAEARREAMKRYQPVAVVAADLMEGKLYRALLSNRQLEEVLVDFWFNHFNVYLNKGADRYLVTSYERDAIRPHVLGKFREMLLATAQHPAMLFYLDNWQSVDPNALRNLPRRRRGVAQQLARRARGLNENYGRELLELHTLGVDGGYTQQDVVEVARCFTGWTIRDPRRGGAFQFIPLLHDRGEKTVLGQRIAAGGGMEDGIRVIDILVRHPSTARFISMKLAQRFVADAPPASLVERMAATFRKTEGDLRAVMQTMVTSREFFSRGAYRAKVKSPLEMVISAARALDAEVSTALVLARQIEQLGQPLYRKEEPTGYPNTGEDWVNTAGLLGRMNFAGALAGNRLPGTRVNLAALNGRSPSEIARAILQMEASRQTRESIGKETAPALVAGLVIGSPDFQRR